jgi:glutaredoxin-related protein
MAKVIFSFAFLALVLGLLSGKVAVDAFTIRSARYTTHVYQSPETSRIYQSSSSNGNDVKPSSNDSSLAIKSTTEEEAPPPFLEGLQKDLQMRWRIFQESQKEGFPFKQNMADVLAGEYDKEATQSKVQELISSAPCVMFTWERSPSCVQANKAFQIMGIADQIKVVRLDDPWSEGNPMRAEIGRMVGRSSVPMIFINGEYVGGFDGGISDEAPGIQTMAFLGTLRPTLEAAGVTFPK